MNVMAAGPSAYHPECAGLRTIPRGQWSCPQCKDEKCGVCGKGPIPQGEDILCGDGKAGLLTCVCQYTTLPVNSPCTRARVCVLLQVNVDAIDPSI